IDVLEKSPGVGIIYAVGKRSELEKVIPPGKVEKIIQETGGFYENAIDTFYHLPDSSDKEKRALFLACDTPFLSVEGLEDLIAHAPDVDFVLPFCTQETFESLFPGFSWPYLLYGEGPLKFGNMALVKPNRIRNKQLLGMFFGLRKVAVSGNRLEEFLTIPRIARAAVKLRGKEGLEIAAREIYAKYVAAPLGIRTRVTDYLSVTRLSGVFSGLLDCRVAGYRTRYPELCFDVDKEETDLAYALENYDTILDRIRSR
ncbi:MAG: hypothetical protein ACE5HZ_08255, partial [Fidelibacterota bacterium]